MKFNYLKCFLFIVILVCCKINFTFAIEKSYIIEDGISGEILCLSNDKTPCDIINGWIIDKECSSPVDFNHNNNIDLSDLIIALKILSGMEQENIQIQINERIELEYLILILNTF